LKGGRMTEGFALVAWPDTCGDTGVMTFIVDRDAVVYEKDLGPDTTAIARAMTSFDPDSTWKKSVVIDDDLRAPSRVPACPVGRSGVVRQRPGESGWSTHKRSIISRVFLSAMRARQGAA
jgi:hypothetical protein